MAKDVKTLLEQVTHETQKALDGNLVSIVLYGSHARGEATPKSDINLFIVVRDSHVRKLEPLLKLVPGWVKQRITAPVIFEQAQFTRSFDTFALEFMEMCSARKVLAGEDPFADFTPDWSAVRRELEEEARQKTVSLKRRWLASGNQDRALRAILVDTVPGYLALLRATLQLQKQNLAPVSTQSVFDSTGAWPGYDAKVWKELWEAAKALHFPPTSRLQQLTRDYLEQARALVRHLDEVSTAE